MSVLWYVIREVCCRYCRELSDILSRQILSYINLENYWALPASQAFFFTCWGIFICASITQLMSFCKKVTSYLWSIFLLSNKLTSKHTLSCELKEELVRKFWSTAINFFSLQWIWLSHEDKFKHIYYLSTEKAWEKPGKYFIINTYDTEKNQLILVCTSQKDFLPPLEAPLKI